MDKDGNGASYVNTNITNTFTDTPRSGTESILVGDYANNDTDEMEGYIDDLAIFSHPLSRTDVDDLYTNGTSGYETIPETQVVMNFDMPPATNPHFYNISNNNAVFDR